MNQRKKKKKTNKKINETKTWFCEKINKTDQSSARLIKKKLEKAQINKIKNEKGEVKTNTTEIQRLIRDYYKQIHVNKMDSLEEMDQFLEMNNLPILPGRNRKYEQINGQ